MGINWNNWYQSILPSSPITVGEERRLTPAEVLEINKMLESMAQDALRMKDLLEQARVRYAEYVGKH